MADLKLTMTEADWDAQQIAINTGPHMHADTCNRKRRAPGELFDSMRKACTCHCVQIVRDSIRERYGD